MRDAALNFSIRIRKPNCVEMTCHQIAVTYVKGRGLDDAVDHFVFVVKKPLVMGAHCGAVGDY